MRLDRAKARKAGLHDFWSLFHTLEPADPYDILIISKGQSLPLDRQMVIFIQSLLDVADNPPDGKTVHKIVMDKFCAL